MTEFLPVSIGLGLGVGVLVAEIFGLAGSGLVVPGYLAIYLTQPLIVVVTIFAGLTAFFLVRVLGSFIIIFGRRRTVLMILAGYLTGMLFKYFVNIPGYHQEFDIIGFIIPGLIAVSLDRWGIIESLCSLLTTSVIVRLILIFIFGTTINQ